MSGARLLHQPTLRQLLNSEAMAEAQVLHGPDLDRRLVQVVTSLTPRPRAGSLLVARLGSLSSQDVAYLADLAGVVIVKPYAVAADSAANPSSLGSPLTSVNLDVEMEFMVKLCMDRDIAVLGMPGYGEPSQVAEDIRSAFLTEMKRATSRLHAHFLSVILEQGPLGLIEELSNCIGRPVAIESSDFKVIAARNMGPTPPSQQSILGQEIQAALQRHQRNQDGQPPPQQAHRIGRRLVVPVLLDSAVVGLVSAMVRPTDDIENIIEYLHPAALAAMVDFSLRRKEFSAFTVTQKSLLKDLLSGRTLSAADQERLEQHFCFDLCDGLLVFAVQAVAMQPGRAIAWPEEPYACAEVEGTRVFVIPYQSKSGRAWQQEAEGLQALIKKDLPDLKIQVGAGRLIQTTLDLPDSYREARQALIVGSMIHGDQEFITGYGELGVRRLLYLIVDHPELDRFYEENLSPLEAYDAEWESELVPTLRVYLSQGANLNSAARAIFIHRHTLRYRLEQIAEILNVDIDSQEVLLNLQIAFLIKEMKGKAQG